MPPALRERALTVLKSKASRTEHCGISRVRVHQGRGRIHPKIIGMARHVEKNVTQLMSQGERPRARPEACSIEDQGIFNAATG